MKYDLRLLTSERRATFADELLGNFVPDADAPVEARVRRTGV